MMNMIAHRELDSDCEPFDYDDDDCEPFDSWLEDAAR